MSNRDGIITQGEGERRMTADAQELVDWSTLEFLVDDDGPWPTQAVVQGHVDAGAFREVVQAELNVQYDEGQFRLVGEVEYGWARKVPHPDHRWMFWPVGKTVRDSRGVFPYTAVDIEEAREDDD